MKLRRMEAVFEVVRDQLIDNLRSLGVQPPDQAFGQWRIEDASAPPRIVWVPVGGQVSIARQIAADSVVGVRQIGTRNERIFVHIWAKDWAAVEDLLNHFVAAARTALTAFPFRAKSTDWTVGQADKVPNGRLCILEIELDIPITFEAQPISPPPHHANIIPTIPAEA